MPFTKKEEQALVEFARIIPNINHSDTTFHEHCINVFDILKDLGADEAITIAGLFHSSMGTEYFRIEIANIEDELKRIIPEKSLELIKLFSSLKNRTETIITGNYQATSEIKYCLALIEYANLLEQSARMNTEHINNATSALRSILKIK